MDVDNEPEVKDTTTNLKLDTTRTGVSTMNESGNQLLQLTPFDEAESKVINLLRITESTIDELQLVPNCDYNKLNELSQSFLQSVFDIQASLKALPEYESSTTTNLNETYLLQKKLEQLHSQEAAHHTNVS